MRQRRDLPAPRHGGHDPRTRGPRAPFCWAHVRRFAPIFHHSRRPPPLRRHRHDRTCFRYPRGPANTASTPGSRIGRDNKPLTLQTNSATSGIIRPAAPRRRPFHRPPCQNKPEQPKKPRRPHWPSPGQPDGKSNLTPGTCRQKRNQDLNPEQATPFPVNGFDNNDLRHRPESFWQQKPPMAATG